MLIDRRSFVLGSASIAATVGTRSLGFAQTPLRGDEFRRQYGALNFRNDIEALKFLKEAQDFGTIPPADIASYGAYLDNLPLMRLIKTDQGPELYHLIQWHAFSLDMTALDHTTIQPGLNVPPDLFYAEQFGPPRASRALAIVHLAMFEAVNVVYQRARSYKHVQSKIFAETGFIPNNITPNTASVKAAIAAAAYITLVNLYPHKTAFTQALFDKLTASNPDSPQAQQLGNAIGASAARQILLLRKYNFDTLQFADGCQSDGMGGIKQLGPNDNSLSLEPQFSDLYDSPNAQDWQVDPIHPTNMTGLGGYWSFVDTFVLDPEELFLPPGPPATDRAKFQSAYAAVRSLGGDPNPVAIGDRYPTSTTRTGTEPGAPLDDSNETFKGIFWGYDATNLLCSPPRLYNMIATSTALDEFPIKDVAEMARYLALINITLADAAIAAWTAKYKFNFARPVTYIRQTQPKQVVNRTQNQQWTPLGAPITNGAPEGANTTPPFPAYPSGHAVFGGALFTAMGRLLPLQSHTQTAFKFVSDEYNGVNRGPTGDLRPYVRRSFASFEAAEAENAQSRIWLGIHWQFDADDGRDQGHKVAHYVLDHALKRI
jgi:membrane-associated phospholipid phosphatase